MGWRRRIVLSLWWEPFDVHLLATDCHHSSVSSFSPHSADPYLFPEAQPGLDHQHLFDAGDDQSVALAPRRRRGIDEAVDDHVFNLHLVVKDRRGHLTGLLVDALVHPHAAALDLALADPGSLFDDWDLSFPFAHPVAEPCKRYSLEKMPLPAGFGLRVNHSGVQPRTAGRSGARSARQSGSGTLAGDSDRSSREPETRREAAPRSSSECWRSASSRRRLSSRSTGRPHELSAGSQPRSAAGQARSAWAAPRAPAE